MCTESKQTSKQRLLETSAPPHQAWVYLWELGCLSLAGSALVSISLTEISYLSRWTIPSQTLAARRGCWPAEPVRAQTGRIWTLRITSSEGCHPMLLLWLPHEDLLVQASPSLATNPRSPCALRMAEPLKLSPPSLQMSLSQWACLWADHPSSKRKLKYTHPCLCSHPHPSRSAGGTVRITAVLEQGFSFLSCVSTNFQWGPSS